MAELKIYSDIQSDTDKAVAQLWGMAGGISFTDVASFCENIPQDDKNINVLIHCDGGDVLEGWGIYDRLRATGKEITTVVEGSAASMATVIMMAAPKERRKAYQNAQILVHNPWLDPAYIGMSATADDLDKAADALRDQQERILDLYVERCGCDRDEMKALMAEDKWIGTDEALRLGLIGEIIQPMSAKTIQRVKCKDMGILDKVINAVKSVFQAEEAEQPTIMAMDLNTASGETIRVDREEGAPAVGDKAEPDGEWLMPDNTTIVVENGVITEIRQPEEQVEVEVESDGQEGDGTAEEERREERREDDLEQENGRLKERIAELEAQVAELTELLEKANAQAKSQDDLRILNMVQMAGGEEKVFASIASHYQPEKREPSTAMAEQAVERNFLKERIEASKNRNKKKK